MSMSVRKKCLLWAVVWLLEYPMLFCGEAGCTAEQLLLEGWDTFGQKYVPLLINYQQGAAHRHFTIHARKYVDKK